MAQRRASLLERQQRRSEQARQRRHWLEAERERRQREEAEARWVGGTHGWGGHTPPPIQGHLGRVLPP